MSDKSSRDSTQIGALEDRHLFQNYGRRQIVLVRGQGCYVYDGASSISTSSPASASMPWATATRG